MDPRLSRLQYGEHSTKKKGMEPDSTDKSFIGVFTTSTDLTIRVWDAAMASMTGIAAEDAVGRSLADIVPNIEARGLLGRFEFVRDVGTSEVLAPALYKYLIPCPPRSASGHFAEMRQLVTISAIVDNGETRGLIVLVEDVTARMDEEKDLAERLTDPDDSVRLQAAKTISGGSEPLQPGEAETAINALGDKNWRVRRTLVDGLSRRAGPDAVASLLEAVRKEHLDLGMLNSALQILQLTAVDTTETLAAFLRSEDHDLRMQAALALGKQKHPEAIGHLLAALDDDNANVRYHVIEALGNLRAAEAIEPLLAIAESRDFFLSFAALDALKQIGDTAIAGRISPLLDDDLLRDAAASTLGATGGVDAAEQMVRQLDDGMLSASVAARSLCELSDRHDAPDSASNEIVDHVRRAIRDGGKAAIAEALSDTVVEGDVIRVAGWIDDDRVREKLDLLLEDERYREAACRALVDQGKPAAGIVIARLKSDDVEIRSLAAQALGSLGSPAGTEALIEALHSDPDIASSALEALGRSGSPEALDALIELLASADKSLRRATVNTLKNISNADVTGRMYGLLLDVDPNVREAAIRVLGDLETPEGRVAVIGGCRDSDELVRIAAVEQLASFPDGYAVKVLSDLIEDEAPRVRAAAVQSLAAFAGEESTNTLHRALKDGDAWVRYFAIRSLSANGEGAKSPELFRDLAEGDPAEQVRVAAAEAMG